MHKIKEHKEKKSVRAEHSVSSDCGCKHKEDACKHKKEVKPSIPGDRACGSNNNCNRNCCEKVAFIDNDVSLLSITEPYLNQLTRFFPVADFEVFIVSSVLVQFPWEAVDDQTPEELLEAQRQWLLDNGATVTEVADLIESLVCRGFRYIWIPSDYTTEFILRGGFDISVNGKCYSLFGGLTANQVYPGVKFMAESYSVGVDPSEFPNLWIFSDVPGSRFAVVPSLLPIIGDTPLDKVVIKSVFTTFDTVAPFTPTPNVAPFVQQIIDATAPGGPLFGVTVESLPLTITGPTVDPVFDPAQIQTTAQAICNNNANPNYDNVIVSLGVGGSNTGRDAFATAVNAYDATATSGDCAGSPLFFDPAYGKVTYFGNPYFPYNVAVPVDVNLGVSAANGNPSPVQIALGLPCDFADYWNNVNFTFDPSYFLAYVWAANCQKVSADVVGIPLRFYPGTHIVVSQWLWSDIIAVANLPISEPGAETVPTLTQNPDWCSGGAFGW